MCCPLYYTMVHFCIIFGSIISVFVRSKQTNDFDVWLLILLQKTIWTIVSARSLGHDCWWGYRTAWNNPSHHEKRRSAYVKLEESVWDELNEKQLFICNLFWYLCRTVIWFWITDIKMTRHLDTRTFKNLHSLRQCTSVTDNGNEGQTYYSNWLQKAS